MQRSGTGVEMAKPFLKWAGGKTQLLQQLLYRAPARIKTYYEPFLGGGALFFALQSKDRFESALLSDLNPELINTYIQVRDAVDDVIENLKVHERRYGSGGKQRADYYYQVRSDPRMSFPVERAARMIFLNKTCFNGLYRVNSRGEFNVPHGRYANPRICDDKGLAEASEALQGVEIKVSDFEEAVDAAGSGDFVYFDPPYVPVSETSYFTAYTAGTFGLDQQERLAETAKALLSRRANILLSNSSHPTIRRMYEERGMHPQVIAAGRMINAIGASRGRVDEFLIGDTPQTPQPRRTPASIRDRARRTSSAKHPTHLNRWRSR